MADDTPLYNLKAVTNEVGLSPETLRAWERRYKLLKPKRTPGGHRLYSRQDIEMLKWLVERQKEGLSISRAVELWHRHQSGEQAGNQALPNPISGNGESMLDELRDQWLAACLAFDDQAANRVLDQAFSLAAPETICLEVLQKGLAQVGEGWYDGRIKVQQEHFASAIAARRLDTLLSAATHPTRPGHLLLACPPGEVHDFILLLVAYLLRRRGWDVVYLGANVPLGDLNDTIQAVSPVLIISAAQTLISAASLRQMSESIAKKGVPLAYGGGIFTQIPAAVQSISGNYLGDEVSSVPNKIEQLLAGNPPIPAARAIPPGHSQTQARLLENEINISKYVASWAYPAPVKPGYLEVANTNFTRMIAAALALGDISLLEPSISWLNGLLVNFGLPVALTRQFYSTYCLALEQYLGSDAGVIQNWIRKQLLSD